MWTEAWIWKAIIMSYLMGGKEAAQEGKAAMVCFTVV